jgi:molybdenum cofactor cytidylyltransferase
VAVIDGARVLALNAIHEAITLATVAPHAALAAHDMIATVKIIPFAVPRAAVDACLRVAHPSDLRAGASGALVRMAPFAGRRAGLVLTRLPGVKDSQLDRAAINLRTRLEGMGNTLGAELRCPHTETAVADSVTALLARGCNLVLVLGASAIVDRCDVVPLGIEAAGGVVEHFGMPVDPGNLMLLARIGAVPVLGVPGCARSLKPSGFDWVLARLCADIAVTRADLTAMSVGGLLADIDARPQPRQPRPTAPRRPAVTAVVLAAGRSLRMGAQNKLVVDVLGAPMITRAVDALLAAAVARVVVVTGHEHERVEAALAGRAVSFVHNPDYAAGMSTSLRAGIRALGAEADAALVCLGDMPWIAPAHVDALIDAFQPIEGREICVPVYQGKRGNPVLFGARFFDEMSQLEGDVGARALIDAHAEVVFQVSVDQSGVLVDVDTAAALERLHLDAPPGMAPPVSQAPGPGPGDDDHRDDQPGDDPDA